MGYKRDAVKGVSWITLLRGVTRALSYVRLAVLGRVLTPTQFGFFGIASLLLALLEILTETGVNVFLVQEKSHITKYISTAWIVSILRGIFVSSVIFLLSPWISNFFNSPKATSVVTLIAFVPLLRGFINPALVTYQKDLLFHKEFRLRSVLLLTEVCTSVTLGILTKSAESFVWGLLASAVLEVVLSFVLIPIWPRAEIKIDQVRHIIRQGWWVTLTGIFLYFSDNTDNISVGKILGSASLGIYQVAYKFSTLPITEVTNVVNLVVFPVYSKFSDDRDRLYHAFVRVTIFTSIGAVVLGGSIFLFAKPLIYFFMGGQWSQAIPAIQILSIYGILRTIFGNFAPLFLSAKRQDYVAQMTLSRLIIVLILVIPLVSKYGMVGAAYAMLISMAVEIPVGIYFASRVLRQTNEIK